MGAVLRCCQHVGIASSQLETCLFFASATCALFNVSCRIVCNIVLCKILLLFWRSIVDNIGTYCTPGTYLFRFFLSIWQFLRCVNQIRIFFASGISFNNMSDARGILTGLLLLFVESMNSKFLCRSEHRTDGRVRTTQEFVCDISPNLVHMKIASNNDLVDVSCPAQITTVKRYIFFRWGHLRGEFSVPIVLFRFHVPSTIGVSIVVVVPSPLGHNI